MISKGCNEIFLRDRRAFSLVEVLIVTAIVAVLTGIVFPVVLSAKERGKKVVCLSNLHQISRAITLYSVDDNDRFPYAVDGISYYFMRTMPLEIYFGTGNEDIPYALGAGRLEDTLRPYARSLNIFGCPSEKPASWNNSTSSLTFGPYGTNYTFLMRPFLRSWSTTQFQFPSNSPIGTEAHWYHQGTYFGDAFLNVAYADQHVQYVQWLRYLGEQQQFANYR
ncbi:MAG: prepilin-type N-terminal cleavage/methylation domain-containing protein [Fimbriimonadaceae bacterium]|nr:prepilin-type N-terminal cleavage/methylation domain-containing protein [Fimbriimonadaceae bacterium]